MLQAQHFDESRTKVGTSRFRANRFQHFLKLINTIPESSRPLRILDVGGWPEYWIDKRPLIERPHEITLLNIQRFTAAGFESAAGDARSMPEFADNSFDVIHSNSVIEHVGQWKDMMAMANEIRRIAPRYFVQTPYYWFPVEPHARTLALHWLPETWRFRLVMTRKCGPFWSKAESIDQAMRLIQSSTLLDKRMFGALFPDAKIVPEKFYGWTKSLMAIRSNINAH
jgi:hypothetical protein